MRTKEMRTNEAGFTLIGMLIAVGIVAILAMIAVPKFTSAIASANTAKIQSDLSTIDTAIAVYEIEHGKPPAKVKELGEYLQDPAVQPPKGDCYIEGKKETISEENYEISNHRVVCKGKTVTAFYKNKGDNKQKGESASPEQPADSTDGEAS